MSAPACSAGAGPFKTNLPLSVAVSLRAAVGLPMNAKPTVNAEISRKYLLLRNMTTSFRLGARTLLGSWGLRARAGGMIGSGCLVDEQAGVMEYWSNGVLGGLVSPHHVLRTTAG